MDKAKIGEAIERIAADQETCAQAIAILRPIASDEILLKKFAGTYAANVVENLQDILSWYLVISLCRMWDETEDAQSIPNVIKVLEKKDVPERKHRECCEVVRAAKEVLESELLDRMRNYRHKNLAHALKQSRKEHRTGPIDDPMWGDVSDLEARTSEIFTTLAYVALDIAYDLSEQREVFDHYVEAFWSSFNGIPNAG